ncbi:MAG TPA: DUF2809 domain-containing protein [Polyangiaceae bacterium]|nr:DUF2809 domain-containing protein [Polyangiaceae bacterium]
MRRTSRAWAAALSFAACAFVAVYRGPGWRPLRSHGGDAFATLFLFLLLGLLPWAFVRGGEGGGDDQAKGGGAPPWRAGWGAPAVRRAALTAAIALGIELLQAGGVVNQKSGLATQLLLGSTFDPWDCLAYAVGIALGLALERAWAAAPRAQAAPAPGG